MKETISADNSSRTNYYWFICACILAVVLLVGNSDLVLGKAAPMWDAVDNYAPMFSLVADNARAGRLMLWNPWSNGGSPDFADPQSGANSPIVLLFGIVAHNPFRGFIAYWMLFWIFGGCGVLMLARHLKCPPWGGLIAALGFVSCGFYTGHGEHTAILYSFSYLPWIVWRFDVALERHSYWIMVEVGALWGLSALGGYPALVILDPLFLILWALGRAWFVSNASEALMRGSLRERLLFCVAGLSIVAVVGVAIMSPCYIGFLQYTKGYTFRAGSISKQRALIEGPLPPQAILTLASPYLYLLNAPVARIWPETDISMSNIYSGAVVLLLAVVGLSRRLRWRLWLGLIAAFFLSCSVGAHLPVRGWLYTLVPPTRFFRFPSLFSAYSIFVFCILAALGSSDLSRMLSDDAWPRRRRILVISILTAAGVLVSYFSVLRTAHLSLPAAGWPSRLLLIVWIPLIACFFLWWRKEIHSNLFVAALLLIAIFDAGSTFALSSGTMYTPLTVSWWNIMSSQHVTSLDLKSSGLVRHMFTPENLGPYRHNRNLALKYSMFANATGLENQFFQPYVFDPILSKISTGDQRVWFSDDPLWLPEDSTGFATYLRVTQTLGAPPLVLSTPLAASSNVTVHESSEEAAVRSAMPISPASVGLIVYRPNTLEFRYQADHDGWLLVADRWAPHWIAEVNGRSVPVLCANFIFRGIPVTRGDNVVRFQYKPRGYVALVSLSWGVLLLVGVGEFYRIGISRKFPATPRQPDSIA